MIFRGLIIAHRDTSYDGKKGRVLQETLTCLDADETVKMMDTVDCVFSPTDIPQAATLVGKTQAFHIEAVRPSNTMCTRFIAKSLTAAKP